MRSFSGLNFALLLLAVGFITRPGYSQDGEALFRKSCGACHTVGSGRLVGPDLAGITEKADPAWLEEFISNSAAMIGRGDPRAVAIGKEFNNLLMPPFTGTGEELSAIIRYLEGTGGKKAQGAVRDTFLLAATPANVATGELLFTGRKPFQNHGPSCISCHSLSGIPQIGGTLAKSLNLSYPVLKGQGVRAILQSPPFPAMVAAYRDHPLTGEEIYHVASYMKSSSSEFMHEPLRGEVNRFLLLGISGWIAGGILLFFLWPSRKRRSVNHGIFSRQLKTH